MCWSALGRWRRLHTTRGAQRGPEGQNTLKEFAWWEAGREQAQRGPCCAPGGQVGPELPGHQSQRPQEPDVADILGLEKSKCLPFVWEEGKEKNPGNDSANCAQPLEKHHSTLKTLSWGAWEGSGVAGISPLTCATRNWSTTPTTTHPGAQPRLAARIQPWQHLRGAD